MSGGLRVEDVKEALDKRQRYVNTPQSVETVIVAAARAWLTPNYEAATAVLNHHLDRLQVFSNTDHPVRFGVDAVQKIVDAALRVASRREDD